MVLNFGFREGGGGGYKTARFIKLDCLLLNILAKLWVRSGVRHCTRLDPCPVLQALEHATAAYDRCLGVNPRNIAAHVNKLAILDQQRSGEVGEEAVFRLGTRRARAGRGSSQRGHKNTHESNLRVISNRKHARVFLQRTDNIFESSSSIVGRDPPLRTRPP